MIEEFTKIREQTDCRRAASSAERAGQARFRDAHTALQAILEQTFAELKAAGTLGSYNVSIAPHQASEVSWRMLAVHASMLRAIAAARATVDPADRSYSPPDWSTDEPRAEDYASGRRAADRDYDTLQDRRANWSDPRVPANTYMSRCRWRPGGKARDRHDAWTQGYHDRWHELRRNEPDYRPGRIGEGL
ncbi:hypothetical protein AAII07_55290 [Microvirga sp. 0TCS3.31]